jgi:putative membrane protein
MRKTIGAALAALTLAMVAAAQDTAPARAGDADRKFVMEATGSGLAEVNLSRMALKSAGRQEVKDFAQHMVTDHSKANDELLALINRKGLSAAAASTMPAPHRALADRLASLSGEEFDKLYMQQMVKDHEDAVKLFETQSKSGQDADLKAFAAKTLPTIKMHLEMARKVVGAKPAKDKPAQDKPAKDKPDRP